MLDNLNPLLFHPICYLLNCYNKIKKSNSLVLINK